jgi:hypothetical protein
MRPASGYRMHDMIESVMVGSAGMLRGWVEVWTTHMLWPACDLDRVGRCGALVGPSNIGKWCAIGQHQLHARLRRLPYRHDEGLYIRSLAAVPDDRTAR